LILGTRQIPWFMEDPAFCSYSWIMYRHSCYHLICCVHEIQLIYNITLGSFHVKSTRNLGSPLEFWQNLVCLWYLWVITPTQIFSPYTTWFLIYYHKDFEYFVKICSIFIYEINRNFVLHYNFKQIFHWLKSSDWPFKWSLNYGILT